MQVAKQLMISSFGYRPGLGEDGGPGRGRQRGAHQHSVVRHHEGPVGRRLLPRRDQAQGRHPRAGKEVPPQGDRRPPLQITFDLI